MRRTIALGAGVLIALLGPLATASQAQDNVTVTGVKYVRGNLVQVAGTVTCTEGYSYSLGFELYQQTGLSQASGWGGTGGTCTGEQQSFVADVGNWGSTAFRRGKAMLTTWGGAYLCDEYWNCDFVELATGQTQTVRLR